MITTDEMKLQSLPKEKKKKPDSDVSIMSCQDFKLVWYDSERISLFLSSMYDLDTFAKLLHWHYIARW